MNENVGETLIFLSWNVDGIVHFLSIHKELNIKSKPIYSTENSSKGWFFPLLKYKKYMGDYLFCLYVNYKDNEYDAMKVKVCFLSKMMVGKLMAQQLFILL